MADSGSCRLSNNGRAEMMYEAVVDMNIILKLPTKLRKNKLIHESIGASDSARVTNSSTFTYQSIQYHVHPQL